MSNKTNTSTEQVLTLTIRPTTAYMILQVIFPFLLSCAIATVGFFLSLNIIMAASLLPLLYLFYRSAYFMTITYQITPERLIYQRGILVQRRDSIELYRIRDFQVVKPLMLRLFGAMHLSLLTTDETHPVFDLQGITGRVPGQANDPDHTLDTELRNRVEQLRRERKVLEVN